MHELLRDYWTIISQYKFFMSSIIKSNDNNNKSNIFHQLNQEQKDEDKWFTESITITMSRSAKEYCHQNFSTTTPTIFNILPSCHKHEYLSNSGRNDEKMKRNNQITRSMKASQVLFNLYLVYIILSHSETPKSSSTTTPILSQCRTPSLLSSSPQNYITNQHQNHYHKHYHSEVNQIESHGGFFLFAGK